MAKTATVRAHMAPALKASVENVLGALGLSPSTAIPLSYEQIVRHHALPLSIGLPNATTRAAMRMAETGTVTRAPSSEELFSSLDTGA